MLSKRNKKLIVRNTAAVIMTAVLLCGCQKTGETPIIVTRKTDTEPEIQQVEDGMTIKEQVQAPSEYTAEIKANNSQLKVTVNAKVVVPDEQGFKLKKVEGRVFTQKDVDKQVEVLLKANELKQRVYIDNDPAQGYTKPELEEMIKKWDIKKAAGIDLDAYYSSQDENYYEHLWKLLEVAPDEAEYKTIEPTIGYDPENDDENLLYGEVKIDNKKYEYSVINHWNDQIRHVSSELCRSGLTGGYSVISKWEKEQNTQPFTKTPEEVRKQTDTIIEQLGLTDMKAYIGEFVTTPMQDDTIIDPQVVSKGYGVYYTRVIEGIPITYTNEGGWDTEENSSASESEAFMDSEIEMMPEGDIMGKQINYTTAWPYESLSIVCDDNGLASFIWENPYTITDLSDEYVFLLPFSDIQAIFEQMIIAKNPEYSEDYYESAEFKIHEVRLGYARVMEKGKSGEGTLIPVWDFFGTEQAVYKPIEYEDGWVEEMTIYESESKYDSLLTINAMDGTIIDRGLGY